jgi:hypothetical protein
MKVIQQIRSVFYKPRILAADTLYIQKRTNMSSGIYTLKVRNLLFPIICSLILTPAVYAGGGAEPSGPYGPAKFEEIPGTDLKRVILDEKSVNRLGIEIGEISRRIITRKQMVGGKRVLPVERIKNTQPDYISSGFGRVNHFDTSTQYQVIPQKDSDQDWIKVSITKSEWERVDKNEPVVVYSLGNREKPIKVRLSGLPPIHDLKRAMLKVYYLISRKDYSFALNERMRVQFTLKGNGENHLVAPYEALHYDYKGKPWVYVNTGQWTYERKSINVKRIEENYALLKSGPPAGTPVVTVGAPLLYGAEVVFKK